MYATIIGGKVAYYGSSWPEAQRVFTDRESTVRASVHDVLSINEAEEFASMMVSLEDDEEAEVEALSDDFASTVCGACEELLDQLDELKVGDFSSKVKDNAQQIADRLQRYGRATIKTVGEGLSNLGKTISESVPKDEPKS